MEIAIDVKDSGRPRGFCLEDLGELIVETSEAAGDLSAFSFGEGSGLSGSQAFYVSDGGIELAGVLFGEGGHDHAGLTDVLVLNDITLPLEPVERAADGRTAHGEV